MVIPGLPWVQAKVHCSTCVESSIATKDGEALPITCPNSTLGIGVAQPPPTAQWFAVYTAHRHEKRVSELLLERDIETVLPLYRTIREWKKRVPAVVELPLFPCYLFVHISRVARSKVFGVPGVLSIVGTPNEPWPLRAAEIEALRLGSKMEKVEPHPFLNVGERVRIRSGPMSGIEGILQRRKNGCRFVLTLEVIMRSVALDVDANDIEVVDRYEESMVIKRG